MTLPLVYSHWSYGLIFLGASLVWTIPEITSVFRQRETDSALLRDRGSFRLIVTSLASGFILAFSAPLVFPSLTFWPHATALFWLALLVMGIGIGLRRAVVRFMGSAFTVNVAVAPKQMLQTTGPFRYVRHPSYAALMLIFLGIGLALGNVVSLLSLLIGASIGFTYRIRIEEDALLTSMGEDYAAYMRHTRRLIPFVF